MASYLDTLLMLCGKSLKDHLQAGRITSSNDQPKNAPVDLSQYSRYVDDPCGFARDVLRFTPTPKQSEAAESLLKPPYQTICISGNEQGKSAAAAWLVLWWHLTRSPSIIITTAPKHEQVKDVLWKEIRKQASRAQLPVRFLPKACRIERGADDFAVGTTARDATSFQGHHGPSMLFVVDEAIGVDPAMFEAIDSMFSPPGHALLCLFNPTETGSRMHAEYTRSQRDARSWHVVRMSALEHPNIEAELKGLPPVVPHAMRLEKFDRLLRKWSQLVGVEVDDPGKLTLATDVLWPPPWATDHIARTGQRPRWWRPGPIAEARLLGRFPRQGVNSVWSDGDWIAASREGRYPLLTVPIRIPQIGADVARFGDDYTETHVRVGPKSLEHQAVNGQDTATTARNLEVLARKWAHWYNEFIGGIAESERPGPITWQDVPIKVDDDGVGGGVTDMLRAQGARVIPISAAAKALQAEDYPNRRSELWFTTADRARAEDLDLSGRLLLADGTEAIVIEPEVVEELKRQAMAATWSMDSRGRRVVCPKDEQKAKLGRSPDGMDAVNLAYAEAPAGDEALPEILVRRRIPYAREGMQQ